MEPKPGNNSNDHELFAALEADFGESIDDLQMEFDPLTDLESENVVDKQLLAEALQLRVLDLQDAGSIPDMSCISMMDVSFGMYDECALSADVKVDRDGQARGWIEIKSMNPLEPSPLPRAVSNIKSGNWQTIEPINDKRRAFSHDGIVRALSIHWPEHRIDRGDVQKYSSGDTKDERNAQDIARILQEQLAPTADHYIIATEYSLPTFDQKTYGDRTEKIGNISLICTREQTADGKSSIAINLERSAAVRIDGENHIFIAYAKLDENNDVTVGAYLHRPAAHLRKTLPIQNESQLILELLTSLNSLVSSRI